MSSNSNLTDVCEKENRERYIRGSKFFDMNKICIRDLSTCGGSNFNILGDIRKILDIVLAHQSFRFVDIHDKKSRNTTRLDMLIKY